MYVETLAPGSEYQTILMCFLFRIALSSRLCIPHLYFLDENSLGCPEILHGLALQCSPGNSRKMSYNRCRYKHSALHFVMPDIPLQE